MRASRFRLIVFDFDGTLVDSNSLKRLAFEDVFRDCPDCLRAIPETLQQLQHQSRYEIIAALAERIPGLSAAQRRDAATRRTAAYSALVEERILARARESPAGHLLDRWRHHAALYVCSLTPIEPLRQVLERAGWLAYFAGVEGYPVSKTEMLRRTMVRHRASGDEALMVGDGDGDAAAAREAGTHFFHIREIPELTRLDAFLTA
jgi:phosphoglycolate phosphatase-like HAD superfamily hydrolase